MLHKKALCQLSSAKGVINAVPPLFAACAASWIFSPEVSARMRARGSGSKVLSGNGDNS